MKNKKILRMAVAVTGIMLAFTMMSCAALFDIAAPSHWPETLFVSGLITTDGGYKLGELKFVNNRGGITENGSFAYSHGTPDRTVSFSEISDIFNRWTDVSVTPGAQFYRLDGFQLENEGALIGMYVKGTFTSGQNSGTPYFIYVTRDVTITGKGFEETEESTRTGSASNIMRVVDLNLDLKAGWNFVQIFGRVTVQGQGGPAPIREVEYKASISTALGYAWRISN